MRVTSKDKIFMLDSYKIEIANIVSSGKFDVELELAAVAEDLPKLDKWIDDVEHSRRNGNRLLIDFVDNNALGILSPNGVYVFTGVETQEKIENARVMLSNALAQLGIISSLNPSMDEVVDEFATQNVVCTADLKHELNLNAVSLGLGLENTEYEPEQFPGAIYRPPDQKCTILLFATGKVVVTGVQSEETAQEAFELLRHKLAKLLD